MSFINSLVGGQSGNEGGAGLNYRADQAAILNPTSVAQTDQARLDAQNGLSQQMAFLQALQGQNGIQNQSNVFNQIQGVANGTGPNPALDQLNQATGQNVAQTAALMAGQRGSAANPGMIARLAGQQGANTQQQAAGQAATMQAQQQLGAMGQLSGIANNQVANHGQAAQSYSQGAQNEQQNLLNSVAQQNNAQVGSTSSRNSANAGISGIAAQGQQNLLGNFMNGVSLAATGIPFADGGVVGGGAVGPQSFVANFMASPTNYGGPNAAAGPLGPQAMPEITDYFHHEAPQQKKPGQDGGAPLALGSPTAMAGGMDASELGSLGILAVARGGQVPALVSPGERYLPPKDVKKVAKGEAEPMEVGKKVPGKPKYPGNDYRNDTVPAKLDAGGIVIPNSVMQAKNPGAEAKAFVDAILARHGGKLPSKGK